MTLSEARAKVRVSMARLEDIPESIEVVGDARELLEIIKPGRHSEAVAITDLCYIAARLSRLADEIAGINGRINA